jgi:GNAT superfamily N-acetyltransferase
LQQLHVRAAEPEDAIAIDELILYLDRVHAAARPDLFCVPTGRPRGDHFLQAARDDPLQHVLLAVRNGQTLGYAHVILKHSAGGPRVERYYSEIDTIAVHPWAQRLGAGRKLIEAALGWAEANGVHDHQVAAHEFNRTAQRLYEQLGFVRSIVVMRRKR